MHRHTYIVQKRDCGVEILLLAYPFKQPPSAIIQTWSLTHGIYAMNFINCMEIAKQFIFTLTAKDNPLIIFCRPRHSCNEYLLLIIYRSGSTACISECKTASKNGHVNIFDAYDAMCIFWKLKGLHSSVDWCIR
jgi:hypothetical protein